MMFGYHVLKLRPIQWFQTAFLYPLWYYNMTSMHCTKPHHAPSLFIRNMHQESKNNLKTYFFQASAASIPHPSKQEKGGEDAAFWNTHHLSVADGVGGWELSGVDAGIYSRELLNRIQTIISNKSMPLHMPLPLLKAGYEAVKSIGSTTCCLLCLDPSAPILRTACLGDSGFFIYRPSQKQIVYRSTFQCHDFNFPYQLGTGSSDLPKDSELLECEIQEGDWIILATDGLWDNLFEDQIVSTITESSIPELLAKDIAFKALKYSTDRDWLSPFAKKENEHAKSQFFRGGKPDDITVVVARILEKQKKITSKL